MPVEVAIAAKYNRAAMVTRSIGDREQVLEASCDTPVGAHARPLAEGGFALRGFAGLPDGSEWLFDEVTGDHGEALGERMLAAGAADLLARATAMVR